MSSVKESIENSLKAEKVALEKLMSQELVGRIAEACSLIGSSPDATFVVGVGTSGILGKKLVASLNSIGVRANFLHPTDALHGGLGNLPNNPLLVMISKSGNTKELLTLWSALVGSDPKIVSITGGTDSLVASISEVVLHLPQVEECDPLGLVPTTSAVMTLAIMDALISGIQVLLNVDSTRFQKSHPSGMLGARLSLKFSEVMKSCTGHPAVVGSATTLKEALISMSMGRIGACVVAERQRLLGIITDGDLRRIFEKSQKIADDLDRPVNEFLEDNRTQTFSPSDLVFVELEKMENSTKKFSVFPVVENDVLVGIAHLHDILGKHT